MDYSEKIKQNLNEGDKSRLKWILTLDEDFEKTKNDDLYTKLKSKYPNVGTLSVISYSLKKFFDLVLDNQEKANYWAKRGAELAGELLNQEKKGELTGESEKKNFKTQSQILEIINDLRSSTSTINKNRYLLLNMAVFQPPLRRGVYATLKFLLNKKQDNKKDNYLLLQKSPMKSYFIINSDKVSKYEKFNKDENKIIEILNQDLNKLLWDSYQENKREYVFESSDGGPYSLTNFTKVILQPLGLNFNILRSSYISDYYVKHPYPQEREAVAKAMRHDKSQAELKYLKRLPTTETTTENKEKILK
jgi:hypothetical protein